VILAFDTSTPSTAVALLSGSSRELRHDPSGDERPGHATRLLPMAAQLLDECSTDWDEVDLVAVGTGPGGFTGLRVGVASARGVAQSLGVMLAGRSSLAALARAALEETGAEDALALIDARRGEVFAQRFSLRDGSVEPIDEPVALEPAALRRPGPETVVVGDGVVRYRSELPLGDALVPATGSPLHRVSACQIAAMATYGVLPAQVSPTYVREPDAQAASR